MKQVSAASTNQSPPSEEMEDYPNQSVIIPRTARRKSSSKTSLTTTSRSSSEEIKSEKKTLSNKKKKTSSAIASTNKTSSSSKKKSLKNLSEDDYQPTSKKTTTPKRRLNVIDSTSSSSQKKKKKKKQEKHYDSDFERNDYDSDVEYEEDIEFLRPKIAQLGDLFAEHKGRICIFSGAGISSSAGLSTYRGKDGIWLRDGMLLNTGNNSNTLKLESPTTTSSNSTHSESTNKNLNLKYFPTLTHMAIKKLYDLGYIKYIITQNSDNLHLKSGIDEKDIVEIHGNSYKEYCEKCNKTFTREDIIVHPTSESIYRNVVKSSSGLNILTSSSDHDRYDDQNRSNSIRSNSNSTNNRNSNRNRGNDGSTSRDKNSIPDHSHTSINKCEYCQSPLKDLIVNFGEKVPQHLWDKALHFIESSTLILAIGSKLSVDPVNSLVVMNPNSKLIICNLQLTPFNDDAFMVIRCKSDDLFNRLVEKIDPPNRFEIPEYVYEIELCFKEKNDEATTTNNELWTSDEATTNNELWTSERTRFQVKSTQLNMIENIQIVMNSNALIHSKEMISPSDSIKLFNGNQFTYDYNNKNSLIDKIMIEVNHNMFPTKFRKLLKSNHCITIHRVNNNSEDATITTNTTSAATNTTTTTTNSSTPPSSSSQPIILFTNFNDLFQKTIRLKYYTNQNKWSFEVNDSQ